MISNPRVATESPKPDENADVKRDELILALVQRQMDQELQRRNTLDGKANNMVGFISIITGIFLGTRILGMSFQQMVSFPDWSYFGTAIALIGSLVLALLAFRVRKWPTAPEVGKLVSEYKSKPYHVVLTRNAATIADAVQKVVSMNGEKARLINAGWWLLVAGLVVAVTGIILDNSTPVTTPDQ